jgi:hypothetical protein
MKLMKMARTTICGFRIEKCHGYTCVDICKYIQILRTQKKAGNGSS